MLLAFTFDSIPPWGLGIGLVVISTAMVELGFRMGRKIEGKRGLNHYPVEAAVMTAVLGLFAFLLAFTFGSTASRYAKTKELTLEDANVVETSYLRADYLPEPHRQNTKELLLEYLRIRVEAVAKQEPQAVAKALERSSDIQQDLWKVAQAGVADTPNPATVNLFVASLNDLFDNATRREWFGLNNRFPKVLWLTLGFLGLLCAGMVGLSAGLHGRSARFATTTLLVSFSLVVTLIIDLDRPYRSLVTGRIDPNAALLNKLDRQKASN